MVHPQFTSSLLYGDLGGEGGAKIWWGCSTNHAPRRISILNRDKITVEGNFMFLGLTEDVLGSQLPKICYICNF